MEQISTLNAFKRHARPIIAGLALGLTLIWAQNALANPRTDSGQAPENPQINLAKGGKVCARAVAQAERRQAIPPGLLKAISHAESGRWDAANGAIVAWPWTVTTGGKGYFLPNRADAVAFVKSLQADGVQNIDVGCMQVNLKYHPDAFPSIDQAFNPFANAAYAADLLKQRFAGAQSWLQAAGNYHSTTAHLNQAYREKISALWKDTAKPRELSTRVIAATWTPPDPDRTQRFNTAFRAQRQGGVISGPGQAIANRVNALKPGAHLNRTPGQNAADSFAQKRQAQLLAWRQGQGLLTAAPPAQP